jgi:hypothetical protein
MKATDFRIGNFVLYDNRIFKTEIISDLFPTIGTPAFSIGVVDWKNIHGIPITEDWLIKFGFEKRKECYVHFSFKLIDYKKYYIFDWAVGGNTEIQFVHELQNLFFALTNNELIYKP